MSCQGFMLYKRNWTQYSCGPSLTSTIVGPQPQRKKVTSAHLHKPNCVQLSYVLGWHRPGSCTVNYTNYYYCAISSNGLCKLLRLRRTYIVMPACTALIGKITQISSISSICTLSSKINFTTRYNSKTDCCYTQI